MREIYRGNFRECRGEILEGARGVPVLKRSETLETNRDVLVI